MECKFSANEGQNEVGVRIKDQEIPKSDCFRYLGSILQKNGELDGDLNHRIQAGWMKWKSASGVLCDRRRPLKLKGKFFRTTIRPTMLYGTECWAVKHQQVHKMGLDMCKEGLLTLRFEDVTTGWIEVQGRRGKGRPRKTLEETLRKDLEYLDLTEDMTQNRAQWRSRIHIADPT
ncbi:hypothetical protein FF2_031104 [Malus domestica]